MNLLLFNLRTDAGDTTLGFTTSWINELARSCSHVFVVTLYAGKLVLEPNVSVYPISRDPGDSRLLKIWSFYRIVWRLLRTTRVDACFAHMTPLLAVLFSPLAKLHRIPVLLWFAHGSTPLELRLAQTLVDRCISATPLSYRLRSGKLFFLGHGVDVQRFAPPENREDDYERTIVSVARLTPRKRIHEAIEALRLLRKQGFRELALVVVGGPVAPADRRYVAKLRDQVEHAELGEAVHFEGAVPFDQVHAEYAKGSVFVNLDETGALDKAILEAMSAGCIPISRNRSFAEIARAEGLQGLVPDAGANALANSIKHILELPAGERAALRARLREIVVRDHSLDGLTRQVMQHLVELSRERRGSAERARAARDDDGR